MREMKEKGKAMAIELLNEYTHIQFGEDGKLLHLINPQNQRSYLAEEGCGLFRLTLTETRDGCVLPGELRLTQEAATRLTVEERRDRLRLRFCELDGLMLTVIADVALEEENITWKLRIENHTEFAVKQIEYPMLCFRTPLGESPETERILIPKMDGILLGNPSIHPWQKNAAGLPYERYMYPGDGVSPNILCVQMTAYYDNVDGILIYTADPEGHPKQMGPVLRAENQIDLSPVHLRPELGGHSFTLEYPVVTRFFYGDWQDAALSYQKWAKTAPWCLKTLSEREGVPDWIKGGAFFLSFRLRYQKDGEAFLDRVPEFVSSWQKCINMPMVAMMCGWEKIGEWAGPDYFPPYGGTRRFKKMCKALLSRGHRIFPFAMSGLKLLLRRRISKCGRQPELAIDYDARKKLLTEYASSVALDQNGIPIIGSDMDEWDGVHAYACPSTDQAMDQICGVSLKMLKDYGVTVQQADQVMGGGTVECYSREHKHPPGRGKWQIESLQHIYDKTRSRCKEENPDFILSEEWISEPFIQCLDIYHARNYDKPQGGLESVPLFSFLYHQYIPCYGGDWTPFLPTNHSGVHFHGWNYVCGNLPAGSPIDMLFEMENHAPQDADPRIMQMAANACAAFKRNTRFLVMGRMLPTAPIEIARIPLFIKGLDLFPRREITVSSILHMFWEAPDGERACAAANISEFPQRFRLYIGHYRSGKAVSAEYNGTEMRDIVNVDSDGFLNAVLNPRDTAMFFI